MTEIEKLERDIDTLKESIQLNRMNLHQRTQQELRGILQHIASCMAELESLRAELKRLTTSNYDTTPN
jgi:chromosome segregation ATPase